MRAAMNIENAVPGDTKTSEPFEAAASFKMGLQIMIKMCITASNETCVSAKARMENEQNPALGFFSLLTGSTTFFFVFP